MSRWYVDTSAAMRLLVGESESDVLALADALHLASAIRLGVDFVVTCDRRMAEAAHDLGIPVLAPG